MNKDEIKIGDWLTQGFALYKENFLLLAGATAVAVVLGCLSIGILAGPLALGVYLITLRLIDEEPTKPEIGDIFRGMAYFAQSFLLVLTITAVQFLGGEILQIIPGIGGILSFLLGIAVQTAAMFALLIIAEKKSDFFPAILESLEVVKQNPLPFALFAFLAGLIAASGALLFMIGVFLTAPMYFASVAVAYRDVVAPKAVDSSEEAERKVSNI